MTSDLRATAVEARASAPVTRYAPHTRREDRSTGLTSCVLVRCAGAAAIASGYLLLLGTTFAGAFVLPAIADTLPGFVNDALALTSGRAADGGIGPWATIMQLQGVGYLLGALIFGIALYRAGVLVRWASLLLAVSGLATAALSMMPGALYRFLAWPNGVAMVALGYSLWQSTRTLAPAPDPATSPQLRAMRAD